MQQKPHKRISQMWLFYAKRQSWNHGIIPSGQNGLVIQTFQAMLMET